MDEFLWVTRLKSVIEQTSIAEPLFWTIDLRGTAREAPIVACQLVLWIGSPYPSRLLSAISNWSLSIMTARTLSFFRAAARSADG
jgi:hypothetical protein